MAPDLITPFPGSAVPVLLPTNSFNIINNPLPYHDFSNSVVHRNPHILSSETLHPHFDIFTHIVHPYDTAAFEHFLTKHNLSRFYPLLVTNLRNGFPLGDMPALTKTVVLPNHPSTIQHAEVVHEYLIDEVKAGRMSGPFSRRHVKHLLHGAFFSSPLLVSVQTQQPGVPDKLRICRHLSKGDREHPSVNSYIHKEQFPTRFDTASRVADVVCLISSDLPLPSFLLHPRSCPFWNPDFRVIHSYIYASGISCFASGVHFHALILFIRPPDDSPRVFLPPHDSLLVFPPPDDSPLVLLPPHDSPLVLSPHMIHFW